MSRRPKYGCLTSLMFCVVMVFVLYAVIIWWYVTIPALIGVALFLLLAKSIPKGKGV